MLTDAVIIEFVKTLPVLVTAGAGAIFGYRNGRKADSIHRTTSEAVAKADEAVTNTNGHLAKLREELTALREDNARVMARNEALQQTITTMAAILSAQRVAPVLDSPPLSLRKDDRAPILKPEPELDSEKSK